MKIRIAHSSFSFSFFFLFLFLFFFSFQQTLRRLRMEKQRADAAVTLQTNWRRHSCQKEYNALRLSLGLQSYARGHLARKVCSFFLLLAGDKKRNN